MFNHYCDHVYVFTCVMAWIKKCFVFIVMTSSAHECKQPYDHSLTSNYPQYYPEANPLFRRPTQHYQNDTQRLFKSNERTNERSIQAPSGKKIESRTEEPYTRIENGSYKILNYPNIYSRRGTAEVSSSKDRIVFPGPTSDDSSYKVPDIPDECRETGICADIPQYPSIYVDKLLRELGDTSRFHIDQLDISDTPDIAQRVGPLEENIELCSSREKVIYPEGGYDKYGKKAVIVNSKSHPVQGVRVEVCQSDQSPCSALISTQDGYNATCRQKFMQRMLWALDDAGKLVEKSFKVPSCCTCMLSHINIGSGFI